MFVGIIFITHSIISDFVISLIDNVANKKKLYRKKNNAKNIDRNTLIYHVLKK